LTVGFISGIALWCVWFVTHLPWVGMSEIIAKPLVLLAWVGTLFWTLRWAPRSQRLAAGLGAGLVSALLGLLILGSKITEPPAEGTGISPGVKPNGALIALGFLVLGTALGAACGGLASRLRDVRQTPDRGVWLGRFAWATVAALAPLLFVGGLVTSTDSGMAVPDWPNTFGANMFLYPLGPWMAPDVFFEHSHRLFGTLVGLAVLVLMILTLKWETRPFVRRLAIACFVLVVIQGTFGGVRVLMGSQDAAQDMKAGRWIAFAHGVLAQITMLLVVVLATHLSAAFRKVDWRNLSLDPAIASRSGLFVTGMMHATILQLVFGAMYRHTRSAHPLWAHVAFSIVVVVFAVAAGFLFTSAQTKALAIGRTLWIIGLGLISVVVIQFILGWATFGLGGEGHRAASVAQALLRTSHQANGALLLGIAAAAFVWGRAMRRSASVGVGAAVPA
jgi:cytochrome c oxidase assembly protein subunit 15